MHVKRFIAMGVLVAAAAPALAATRSISLSGQDATGYFATIGLNAEELNSAANSDPSNAKFFNYPTYTNPNPDVAASGYVMAVEPYKFGLSYPTPLHPTGPGEFAAVTGFSEGQSEDADFANTNIGNIQFNDTGITGVGTEIVAASVLTITLSGSEFQSTNRTQLVPAGDVGPFGPSGRSNRNEFANVITLTPGTLTGTGLTFTDGVLTSIDFSLPVALNSTAAAVAGFGNPALLGFDASGTLTFDGNSFAFAIAGQDSTPFASDVRVLLNRGATVDAVGSFSIPEPTSLAMLGLGGLALLRRKRS